MNHPDQPPHLVSFGIFQADLGARELRKNGVKLRLQGQPFQVLVLLLEHAGQVVTREELRQKLWSGDTFVDFDNGLNTAINKIREALGDSAESPRFIETVPRRGYRFIAGPPEDAPLLAAVGRPIKGPWSVWLLAGTAGVFILATAFLAFLYLHQKTPVAQAMRLEISAPEKTTLGLAFALSPDGRKLAFVGTGVDGQTRLWIRSLETLEARPLDGTEGADWWPIWSPDSRFIAFSAQGKLKKIEVVGGPPVTLCDAPSVYGGAWTSDGRIIFGSDAGIQQVSASGGSASPIVTGGFAVTPSLLPDGRHFVYSAATNQGGSGTGVYVGSVATKPQEKPLKKLLSDFFAVAYAPSSDPAAGYLLFVRVSGPFPVALGPFGTLMAQPFDTRRLELIGEPVPIAEQVSNVSFSASTTDVLVYVKREFGAPIAQVTGFIRGQLTWFDWEGKVLGAFGDLGIYRSLALSPDGKRVVFERVNPQNPNTTNLWLYDFARGVTTRFTFDSAWDSIPVWSPDGSHIAFGSNRNGGWDLYQKPSSLAGEDELLFKSNDYNVPSSWSPDGRFLMYFNPVGHAQMWLLPRGESGTDRKPVRVDSSEFNEGAPRFSPNGRWIAYSSDESGRSEIYVRPFDVSAVVGMPGKPAAKGTPVTGKWMLSKGGGTTPLWRGDGKELFYLSLDGMAMAVEVSTSGVFQAGVPKALFKVPAGELFWDVTPDGKRFLMAAPSAASTAAQPPFTVVLSWPSLLKK